MQTIIRNTTGELITNVGDDVKNGVRDIVNRGYRNGKLSHTRVASEIESTLDGINNKRARCIARTEIKRAQTTSNYVVARERGANAYKYKCGGNSCDVCKVDCGKVYPITDLSHLPPRHPNCCCGVRFFKDPSLPPVENKPMVDNKVKPTTSKQPTKSIESFTLNNKVKKPFDDFADDTALSNREYKVFVSSNGEVSPLAKGASKSVSTSFEQQEWIKKQNELGNDVYCTHNHSYRIDPEHNTPDTYTIFSLGDLENFSEHIRLQKSLSAEGPCNRITITRVKDYVKKLTNPQMIWI